MITEDYVSFETAKLLKEKGFNWEWSPFYSEQDRDEWARDNNYNIPNPNYDANIPFDSEILNVIAPHVSLQMAMKWLREEKGFYIGSTVTKYGWFCEICEVNEENPIEDCDYNCYDELPYFDTYEEAVESAIEYCLTDLI